jgi:methyl-accepting chemotaxis protein
MNWFYNLKISAKLLTGFVLVALIAGVVGIFGIINIRSLDKSSKELYENMTVPISELLDISVAFQQSKVYVQYMINADSKDEIEKNAQRITSLIANVTKLCEEYEKTIISDDMRKAFDEFLEARKAYGAELNKAIELARENRDAEAWARINESGELGKAAEVEQNAINKMVSMKVKDARLKSENNAKQADTTTLITVLIVFGAVALSVLLGLFISRIISKPLMKTVNMIKEMKMGHLGMRLRMDTKDEVGQMAKVMDEFADDIQNVVIGSMNKISKGDVSDNIVLRDDKDEIAPALKNTIDTIRALTDETNRLIKSVQEGKLNARGNSEAYSGSWKELVVGINNLIDSFVAPINMTAKYVDRISKGDIPPKVTDTYYGDFNEIKNNLNTCIDAINALVTDVNQLTQAAVEGKLSTRADASKHGGEFAKIVSGVNNTLDAVIEPVMETAAVLDEMAKGNLHTSVKGNYKGDHARIKESMNYTITAISGYINEISDVLTKMAGGDLNVGITGDYMGDFVEIKNSLNRIIRSFNQVLGEINAAAEQVASGSRQVSDSSQALSQGSTEQAGSIEELTASMTEIASQTKQNAINANQANELALSVKNNAAQGNEQMKSMLKAMDEINQSSNNISKIIKVIDEIAFQTNILALNAAVEAARAGQHGKGFAVVAEEVRNLAARSANAAKETTSMIAGSIKKVEDGTRIANETADALNNIVEGVSRAADIVAEIADASNEQATGIAQVNSGINQVSQVTQTISATAEESAAASEELSSQAELLKNLVSKFKISNDVGYEGNMDDLNPELLKMLGNVSGSRKTYKRDVSKNEKFTSNNIKDEFASSKPSKFKISLSDTEFDKY